MDKYRVVGGNFPIAEWMAQRIPYFTYGATPFECIGLVDRNGNICAGALFENRTDYDIHAHIAAERLTRRFLGECFRFCFDQQGVDRITCPVLATNGRAAQFVEHLGFQFEGRMRRAGPGGVDTLIYGMLAEECRWLRVGMPRKRADPGYRREPAQRFERLQFRV